MIERKVGDLFIERDEVLALPYVLPKKMGDPNIPGNLNLFAAYTLPAVNQIREWQPHVATACDRGGRLYATAIKAMWHTVYPMQDFPTVDNDLHFARINYISAQRSDELKAKMSQRVHDILSTGRQLAGLEDDETSERHRLRALFIDDHMMAGRVRRFTENLVSDTATDVHFAVMMNSKHERSFAESVGNEGRLPKMSLDVWGDPKNTGIDYDDEGNLVEVPTDTSIDFLDRMHIAISAVAKIAKTHEA